MEQNRRVFLKESLSATAAVAAPLFVPPSAFGANDRITYGVIGTGKRVGKTAVSGWLARRLDARGLQPASEPGDLLRRPGSRRLLRRRVGRRQAETAVGDPPRHLEADAGVAGAVLRVVLHPEPAPPGVEEDRVTLPDVVLAQALP